MKESKIESGARAQVSLSPDIWTGSAVVTRWLLHIIEVQADMSPAASRYLWGIVCLLSVVLLWVSSSFIMNVSVEGA